MIAIVQVVDSSSVQIENKPETKRGISKGFLVFLGISDTDTKKELDIIVKKLINLRVFPDENKKMNLDIKTVKGEVLLISQFTLLGNLKKCNRPSFTKAAGKELATSLYELFADKLISADIPTTKGYFGEHMDINVLHKGPVTIILDSEKL